MKKILTAAGAALAANCLTVTAAFAMGRWPRNGGGRGGGQGRGNGGGPHGVPEIDAGTGLRGLVSDLSLSAIIVTHDLAVARMISHRMMVMRNGTVVESGLTDQILDDPQSAYAQLLVASVLQP